MYFCGSLCKLIKLDVLGDNYGMMFFMCENYEYDLPKRYGKDRAKVAPEHMLFVFVSLTLCYDSNFYWTKSPRLFVILCSGLTPCSRSRQRTLWNNKQGGLHVTP